MIGERPWRPPRETGPEPGHHSRPGTPTPHQPSPKTSRKSDGNNPGPVGGFRDGFRRGALDALRLMGRRCHCLACAVEADRLVDYYLDVDGRWAS